VQSHSVQSGLNGKTNKEHHVGVDTEKQQRSNSHRSADRREHKQENDPVDGTSASHHMQILPTPPNGVFQSNY